MTRLPVVEWIHVSGLQIQSMMTSSWTEVQRNILSQLVLNVAIRIRSMVFDCRPDLSKSFYFKDQVLKTQHHEGCCRYVLRHLVAKVPVKAPNTLFDSWMVFRVFRGDMF